jgi:hypothetical protein
MLSCASSYRSVRAFGKVADEGDFLGRPNASHWRMDKQLPDDPSILGDGHIEVGSDSERSKRAGVRSGARVLLDINVCDRSTSPQVLDVGAIV